MVIYQQVREISWTIMLMVANTRFEVFEKVKGEIIWLGLIQFRMMEGAHVKVELNSVGRLVAAQKLCKCMKGILFYLNASDDLVATS